MHHHNQKTFAIEKDPLLQATLRGKNFNVIDSDFLNYNSGEQFDLIIANFPFSDGEHHLHKAIDIMFSGQIVCLLNAQTIKNPHTNEKRRLVQRLEELNASIEFLNEEFLNAERKTRVEVALIYIDKRQTFEDSFFDGVKEDQENVINLEESFALEQNTIEGLVKSYNGSREKIQSFIVEAFQNHSIFNNILNISVIGAETGYGENPQTLTQEVKLLVNQATNLLKERFWKRVLELPEVRKKITNHSEDRFMSEIEKWKMMAFSESNILQFVINLTMLYPNACKEGLLYIFDESTKYAFYRKDSEPYQSSKDNIQFVNAWKTNNAFKINERIVLPLNFWLGASESSWERKEFLDDLEVVLGYYGRVSERSMDDIVVEAIKNGQTRKIDTEFFEVSVFKKGTMHLRFKDKELLRRFNIDACKEKGWLPHDYSNKSYESMNEEEKELVKNFEGKSNYNVFNESYKSLRNVSMKSLPLLSCLPS
ncbi:DUF4942 domain-containing protein [Halobacteriovorax sp. CON-3]|uniref:DUF4942 domain-containing protein n=1 Tax=Halobacteriovorax sp. CON-3 TaxID=3157710 RepID=UPI00371B3B50